MPPDDGSLTCLEILAIRSMDKLFMAHFIILSTNAGIHAAHSSLVSPQISGQSTDGMSVSKVDRVTAQSLHSSVEPIMNDQSLRNLVVMNPDIVMKTISLRWTPWWRVRRSRTRFAHR
jgi:hypothetical protein